MGAITRLVNRKEKETWITLSIVETTAENKAYLTAGKRWGEH